MPASTQSLLPSALRDKIAHWFRKRSFLSELNGLDQDTRGQILHDLQLSEGDLQAMAAGSLSPEGLSRVLKLLQIDAVELTRGDPALMLDLQRSCSKCRDWRDCGHALDKDEFSRDVEDYCLNKDTLRALAADRQA